MFLEEPQNDRIDFPSPPLRVTHAFRVFAVRRDDTSEIYLERKLQGNQPAFIAERVAVRWQRNMERP